MCSSTSERVLLRVLRGFFWAMAASGLRCRNFVIRSLVVIIVVVIIQIVVIVLDYDARTLRFMRDSRSGGFLSEVFTLPRQLLVISAISKNPPEETPNPRRDSKKTGRDHVYYWCCMVLFSRGLFLGLESLLGDLGMILFEHADANRDLSEKSYSKKRLQQPGGQADRQSSGPCLGFAGWRCGGPVSGTAVSSVASLRGSHDPAAWGAVRGTWPPLPYYIILYHIMLCYVMFQVVILCVI